MTNEEKLLIKECRIMIVGKGDFITYIKKELRKLYFCKIAEVETGEIFNGLNKGILIEYTGDGSSELSDIGDILVIYPFDFIDGASAIVVFPGDDRSWVEKQNIRQWIAEYIRATARSVVIFRVTHVHPRM